MINLAPQLAFGGRCRQAFEYYAKLLDGEITVMNSFGDSALRGNDVPARDYKPMRGFNVSLHTGDTEEARRIFDGLAEGGKVITEPSEVDWADLFAMVEDRFGVPWLVLAAKPK